MTMSPVELERVVRRNDNDITEIYEMLASIQGVLGRHTRRLGELGAQLGSLETKVDGLETKVDGLDTKVDGLGASVQEILGLLRG